MIVPFQLIDAVEIKGDYDALPAIFTKQYIDSLDLKDKALKDELTEKEARSLERTLRKFEVKGYGKQWNDDFQDHVTRLLDEIHKPFSTFNV
jgi:hypothetical protein